LHAAWKGQLPAVRWLVERGARLNRQGKEWAALHYAAFAGHAEVVAYLLERGADINALSTNGSTPLMMAAREGREAIARTLLAAGARRDIVNERGDDAMRWAMRNNNLQIAQEIAGAEKFAPRRPSAESGFLGPARAFAAGAGPADMMLAQARKMEAAGRRDEALKLYRGGAGGDSQGGSGCGQAPLPPRHRNGDHRGAASPMRAVGRAELRHAGSRHRGGKGRRRRYGERRGGGRADDWLRRARALEAAGRRKEAMQAYRQAASVLRGGGTAPPIPGASPRGMPAAWKLDS
jgi:tetratricopeptide (TPR) repeat protein